MSKLKNEAPESHPWTVFADEAAVRIAPGQTAQEIKRLKTGDAISGAVYIHPETDEEWLETSVDGKKAFVLLSLLMRVHPNHAAVKGNLSIGTEFINRWWGIPLTYEADDLTEVPPPYIIEDGKKYRLRAAANDAVKRMIDAAAKEGVMLRVVSAYRAGDYQKGLYERACAKDGANQRYSARPGHSEHQLGTAVDICDLEQKHAFEYSFGDTTEGKWLAKSAARFGFARSYSDDNIKETGYISEPWHWRYWGKSDAE